MGLIKTIQRILDKIYLSLYPKGIIRFYRKRGMKIGSNCEINKSLNVITEPYLVRLGDHVRITSGVKFITHDGGLHVARNYPGGYQEDVP